MSSPRDLPDPLAAEAAEAIQALPAALADEVSAWLGRLVLLYGVPLNYLIPDESMLPPESLRFFFLDPLWIEALVQGACSLGSNGCGDALVEQALDRWVQPEAPADARSPGPTSRHAAGVRDGLRLQHEAVSPRAPDVCLNWPLTGFLLRSAVVEGWRGIEILAYRSLSAAERPGFDTTALNDEQRKLFEGRGVVPVRALRIEQLGGEVMLGLFNGIVDELVVRQPREGLHFGLTWTFNPCAADEAPAYTRRLREAGWKDPHRAGEPMSTTLDLCGEHLMREQSSRGVVRIAALAARLQSVLGAAGELRDGRFTSAEFAIEMIESAGEFTFCPEIRMP